jgi:methylmalonyl-CoA mutase C-terminal domain/subunit
LAQGVDRRGLRLLLLGALNWTQDLVPARPSHAARDRSLFRQAAARACRAGIGEFVEIRPKVLVTKIGLDGHDRGSRIVAAYLRDAGMEVIYTPPWQEIPAVVKLATEEDVDVIGISSLATDHLIVPKLMTALREAGLDDVAVVIGGIVPDEDEDVLLAAGVARVFHPGGALEDIAAFIRDVTPGIRARRAA